MILHTKNCDDKKHLPLEMEEDVALNQALQRMWLGNLGSARQNMFPRVIGRSKVMTTLT